MSISRSAWQVSLVSVLLIWSSAREVLAQGKGYIQIASPPKVSIFLDGKFRGETNTELGGLILEDVPSGNHLLKAVKQGFIPQEKNINLNDGQVYKFSVEPFVPAVEITEGGEKGEGSIDLKVGSIVIQSLPIECKISIPSIGVSERQKTQDRWTANKVPEGTHEATFSGMGKTLRRSIVVKANDTTQLMVNFIKGKIEVTVRNASSGLLNRVGSNATVSEPRIVRLANPKLPHSVASSASMVVRVLIDEEGKAVEVLVLESTDETLNEAVIESVKQSVFTPGYENNAPKRKWLTIPFHFTSRSQ